MKRELDTIKGASQVLRPGHHITQTVMGAVRIYRVTDVDAEKDKIWGAWVEDADTERWWTLDRDNPAVHPSVFGTMLAQEGLAE